MSYFGDALKVEESREAEVEEEWPEEKMMAAAARIIDVADRQEKVASSLRLIWAEEMLMAAVWEKEKRRKDLRRWSRSFLTDIVQKVVSVCDIVRSLVGKATYETEQKRRLGYILKKKQAF